MGPIHWAPRSVLCVRRFPQDHEPLLVDLHLGPLVVATDDDHLTANEKPGERAGQGQPLALLALSAMAVAIFCRQVRAHRQRQVTTSEA